MITPQQTADHFLGSGALSYDWWATDKWHVYPVGSIDAYDDWHVTLGDGYEADTPAKTVTHQIMLNGVRKIARSSAAVRDGVGIQMSTQRECRTFLRDPDDADFDADLADQVLQYIVFGEVIYG